MTLAQGLLPSIQKALVLLAGRGSDHLFLDWTAAADEFQRLKFRFQLNSKYEKNHSRTSICPALLHCCQHCYVTTAAIVPLTDFPRIIFR
ncbi:hypothetical protein EYF80_005677 [Liparis tanakae]|uniref:Uncharacterized protein n=1 Tax=Liparis tanakae TaxID=230148 RepID=A0A4Z2J295_9TELE|nr:hypothetical protein EYF80_005677 [Liparis tanakae]